MPKPADPSPPKPSTDEMLAALVHALAPHRGANAGVSAEQLAQRLDLEPRAVRRLISMLRAEGMAVCARPETGYFVAETPAELADACLFLERRALHSLRLLARMRRVSMPTLLGQLNLNMA
jgi:biotin operon repressor